VVHSIARRPSRLQDRSGALFRKMRAG